MAAQVTKGKNTAIAEYEAPRKWGYDIAQVDEFLDRAHKAYDSLEPLLKQEDIQNVVRHLDGVDVDGAERLEDFASTTVLLFGHPFEVVVGIVRDTAVFVVAFERNAVVTDRSWSLECKENDGVAVP